MTHTQYRPQRTTYQTVQVRPDSLVGNRDVALIDGDWREVFDVYTYGDMAELLEMYVHDKEATALIKRHLADDTHELYAIVRYLVEEPGAAELTTPIKVFRRCDLLTVQDPAPGSPNGNEDAEEDSDPIVEVLSALYAEVTGDGQVEVLDNLSVSAGLVWNCRAEACNEPTNSTNRDTCHSCGAPRPRA